MQAWPGIVRADSAIEGFRLVQEPGTGVGMATATTSVRRVVPGTKLRMGSLIMAIGSAGLIGYGVLFFFRNFGSFLELGIGGGEVNVSKTPIKHFSPSLYD